MSGEGTRDAAWLLDAFNQLSYSNEMDRACRPEHYAEYEAERVRAAAVIARLDVAERERDALREALDSIAVYGDDTLSGPVSEAAYRHWHRDGVRVMRDRARAALTANHSAPVVEE